MNKLFRFAVVGTGDIAGFYLDHFNRRQNKDNVEFAGALDKIAERGEKFIEKFGGKLYDSLEKLLADPEIDAVVNLTPAKAHEEITYFCLKAGKHVHSEKPLALSTGRAEELIGMARAKGVVLACSPFILLGHNQREVKRLLDTGRIGKAVSVAMDMFHGRVESWHDNPEQFYGEGAGPLLDVGPYPVSLMIYWFGNVRAVEGMFDIAIPERVTKSGRHFRVTQFDQGVALLRFENGVIGRIAFSYANCHTGYHGLEIQGTEGAISLSSMFAARGELRIAGKDSQNWDQVEGDPSPQPASGVDWSGGIFELVAAVRENRQPANSADLALRTLDVLLALNEAAKTERTIYFREGRRLRE